MPHKIQDNFFKERDMEIIKYRKRRAKVLKTMIGDYQAKLQDYHSGHRHIDSDTLDAMDRQMGHFEEELRELTQGVAEL